MYENDDTQFSSLGSCPQFHEINFHVPPRAYTMEDMDEKVLKAIIVVCVVIIVVLVLSLI